MTPAEELLARAENGNAQAQLELGLACQKPFPPTHAQHAESASWYRKAAEQGLAEAQYQFGIVCQFGLGVEKNAAEAIKWLTKAADQNHDSAISQLGWMFLNGTDVEKNTDEAIKWFRKAADQGSAPAQYNLGNLYADGRDVPKDDAQAVHWYRKAAEQGNDIAQYCLGGMCAEGRGVARDDNEALAWFQKAAENGYSPARSNLRRWPPRPVQISAKTAATRKVEDLADIIKANPEAVRILNIRSLFTGYPAIGLQVHVARILNEMGDRYSGTCEIICFQVADYSIRPMNPALMMGGPTIEIHEKHALLENGGLQIIPGGDGEIFRPPLQLKLLVLDQSYVIAERFELRTPIENRTQS